MTVYLTSDLHLGHARCATEFRGFDDADHHDETIIKNWNETVTWEDAVVIVGDAVMGRFEDNVKKLSRLVGQKYLIPGNHDRVHASYTSKREKRMRFHEMYREQGVTILSPIYFNWGFIFCHFPYIGDSQDEDRYDQYRPVDEGLWLIHGHTHSEEVFSFERQFHVGVDAWDMRPVALNEVRKLIEEVDSDSCSMA